ncbi:GntR family transcriptional regulator [Microbacterium sp. YJN-G]|uniref:GntR family transcriptional regulator n=1 Tax=Microbacterium sp. YJN-G TaxID=2763257 RepID=UPI0018780F0F|nr:GntR family transcriptional regulator [Microbacterium sp. YJN-G]
MAHSGGDTMVYVDQRPPGRSQTEQQHVPQPGTEMRKQLLADGLFHLIGERIVSGELAPGARIRDAALAAELAVSRTPVREALQRLERIGLVTMYPSRYTEVTLVTAESIARARAFAGMQAGFIARLTSERLTEDELATASVLIGRIAETVFDAAACSQARRDAIRYLSARSGDPLHQHLFDDASLTLARALKDYAITPEERPVVIAACEELTAALRRHDADAAERACREIYGVR